MKARLKTHIDEGNGDKNLRSLCTLIMNNVSKQ